MVATERRPLTRLPESPVVNEVSMGFSCEKARGYLNLKPERLKQYWEEFVKSEVTPCPDFVQEFKRPQKVRIEDGRRIVIPGRFPFFVPDMSVESLARFCRVDIKELTKGATFIDSQHKGWMLVDAILEHGVGKSDNEAGLTPVGFGLKAYFMFRNLVRNITGEFPDKKTWSILSGSVVGGCPNPVIAAKGERGEEGLEMKLFPWGINSFNGNMVRRVGWVKS